MSVLQRVLKPLRQAARAFFVQDLSLRKHEGHLALVLEEPAPKGKAARDDPAKRREREELALILQQLRGVLAETSDARSSARHLIFVEHALEKKGLRALHKLPVDVLQRALDQFEALVTNWSPVGLANLRSKIAVAIIDREHMDPNAEADLYSTAMPVEALESAPRHEATAPARSDDDALAAAYAALGAASPAPAAAPAGDKPAIELHTELNSPSGKAAVRAAARTSVALPEIRLRDLQN
jgi:hypothetical protein